MKKHDRLYMVDRIKIGSSEGSVAEVARSERVTQATVSLAREWLWLGSGGKITQFEKQIFREALMLTNYRPGKLRIYLAPNFPIFEPKVEPLHESTGLGATAGEDSWRVYWKEKGNRYPEVRNTDAHLSLSRLKQVTEADSKYLLEWTDRMRGHYEIKFIIPDKSLMPDLQDTPDDKDAPLTRGRRERSARAEIAVHSIPVRCLSPSALLQVDGKMKIPEILPDHLSEHTLFVLLERRTGLIKIQKPRKGSRAELVRLLKEFIDQLARLKFRPGKLAFTTIEKKEKIVTCALGINQESLIEEFEEEDFGGYTFKADRPRMFPYLPLHIIGDAKSLRACATRRMNLHNIGFEKKQTLPLLNAADRLKSGSKAGKFRIGDLRRELRLVSK